MQYMLEVNNSEQLIKLCKALSSPVRLKIVQLLYDHQGMNLNELAMRLNVTNSAMTAHIRLMEEAGIIFIETTSGKRGIQKRCRLRESKFLINLLHEQQLRNTYDAEIPIGSYIAYEAVPTCGIATAERIVGNFDDPRVFADPERLYAAIIWFSAGYLEYRLPNYMHPSQRLVELQLTQELASEAKGFNEDWPSDIYFAINGVELGHWTSPGAFGLKRGIHTPDWWVYGLNQYGLLKPLVINRQGTFIDGNRIGEYTLDDLYIESGSEIRYRISAPQTAEHARGLTLYGRGFGNYNHGIKMRMVFENIEGRDT